MRGEGPVKGLCLDEVHSLVHRAGLLLLLWTTAAAQRFKVGGGGGGGGEGGGGEGGEGGEGEGEGGGGGPGGGGGEVEVEVLHAVVEHGLAGDHEGSAGLLQARHVEVDLLVHAVPPAPVRRVAGGGGGGVPRQHHAWHRVKYQGTYYYYCFIFIFVK